VVPQKAQEAAPPVGPAAGGKAGYISDKQEKK